MLRKKHFFALIILFFVFIFQVGNVVFPPAELTVKLVLDKSFADVPSQNLIFDELIKKVRAEYREQLNIDLKINKTEIAEITKKESPEELIMVILKEATNAANNPITAIRSIYWEKIIADWVALGKVEKNNCDLMVCLTNKHYLDCKGTAGYIGSQRVLLTVYDLDPKTAALLMIHEIAHSIGARHVKEVDKNRGFVMYPFLNEKMTAKLDEKSIKAIREWIKSGKKKK